MPFLHDLGVFNGDHLVTRVRRTVSNKGQRVEDDTKLLGRATHILQKWSITYPDKTLTIRNVPGDVWYT